MAMLRVLTAFSDNVVFESLDRLRQVAGVSYGIAWRYVRELSNMGVLKVEKSGRREVVAAGGNWVDQVGWIARAIAALEVRDIVGIGVKGVVRVSVIPLYLAGHMFRSIKMWLDSQVSKGALVGPDTEVPLDVVYGAARRILVEDLATLLGRVEEYVRSVRRSEFGGRARRSK